MEGLKCKVCGGPLPEKALIVIGSLRAPVLNKPVRTVSVVVLESEGFAYPTLRSNAVCGHWCAMKRISQKVEEVMDGPKAAEAMKEKVPA